MDETFISDMLIEKEYRLIIKIFFPRYLVSSLVYTYPLVRISQIV